MVFNLCFLPRKTSSSHKGHSLTLLVSGYPNAFLEFFELTEGGASDSQIINDEQLMTLLRSNLASCEDYTREGHLNDAFSSRTHLAKIFREHGAISHAKHHLMKAEAIAMQSNSIRLKIEAWRELGVLFEQEGVSLESHPFIIIIIITFNRLHTNPFFSLLNNNLYISSLCETNTNLFCITE